MTLPSPLCGPTTETVGFFHSDADRLARWLADCPGDEWRVVARGWESVDELCRFLRPGAPLSRHVLIPWGEWTAVLTDGPLGTDVGMLPSLAARQLSCTALRATATTASARFPAVVLEVYDPAAIDELRCLRTISAANDGGRWVFAQSGEPYAFEQLDAYRHTRVQDRFTAPVLATYLRELGVPTDVEFDLARLASTVLVERR